MGNPDMADESFDPQRSMRAWQSPAPGLAALELVTRPRPIPGEGMALIRVEAAALNFSDLLMLDDKYQVRPQRPFVPGQELAGTVAQAGPRCDLKPGDRIASKVEWGGFAEYALVRADMAMHVPAGFGTAEAAALPVSYTTAYVALTESTSLAAGETVLVLSATSGVGLAAVQIARHLGARVIAAAGGADKMALALSAGADAAVDYRDEGWREKVKVLTGGRGVDVVFDPVGGNFTLEALRLLAWKGRLLIVGFASGKIPEIPANRLLLKRASAIGVFWSHDRDRDMLARVERGLFAMAEANAFKPHVDTRYTFDRLPEALAALRNRETTGKVVVTLQE
jgi:NADPH:quinone reductase